LAAPTLSIAKEEALLRSEPIDGTGPAIALQRALEGIVRRERATIIGNVLAEGELALDVK
jgi:hypothetical protein